jgi:hypothetical protein
MCTHVDVLNQENYSQVIIQRRKEKEIICWKNSHWRRFIFVESKRVVLVGLISARIDQNSGQYNTDVLKGL